MKPVKERPPKLTPEEKRAEKQKAQEWEKARKEKEKADRAARKEEAKQLKAQRKDPAYRAQKKAELKELKKKRKEFRKELKERGLKNRADFETFASEVGLGLPEGTAGAAFASGSAKVAAWWRIIAASMTLPTAALTLAGVLGATFLIAYVTEEKGHFTINLTADMMREGFTLSEKADFEDSVIRLFATEITNSNATSVYEMNRNLHQVDGSHNGPGYMAYTFYLRNEGEQTVDYGYTVNILSETLNTGSAAWLMFYEDDRQIIYAKAQEDGTPEVLYGYPAPPFEETAYDAAAQYYEKDGKYGVITTPFVDAETALQGYVTDFGPGDVKKYTAIVWLEGDDPDCNNAILGGHVGFNIQFERLGEDETGYFKGLFRTEYDKTYHGKPVDEIGQNRVEGEAHTPEQP